MDWEIAKAENRMSSKIPEIKTFEKKKYAGIKRKTDLRSSLHLIYCILF